MIEHGRRDDAATAWHEPSCDRVEFGYRVPLREFLDGSQLPADGAWRLVPTAGVAARPASFDDCVSDVEEHTRRNDERRSSSSSSALARGDAPTPVDDRHEADRDVA